MNLETAKRILQNGEPEFRPVIDTGMLLLELEEARLPRQIQKLVFGYLSWERDTDNHRHARSVVRLNEVIRDLHVQHEAYVKDIMEANKKSDDKD